MLRTHTCGQLTVKDVGAKVTLCGWVASRRDHGKIIFIDLRDRYGITQIVFAPDAEKRQVYPHTKNFAVGVYEKAKELGNEYVTLIQGEVNRRPEKTENRKLPTGEIEVFAAQLTIINSSSNIPFEIKEDINASGDLRLKYRYLDLRRKRILGNLCLRH
ncbi:unnamed protein product, partial [marine sediment metagenome]